MYTELLIDGVQLTQKDVQKLVFLSLDSELDGVSVPLYFLPQVAPLLPSYFVLATHINYPNGDSDAKVRQHAVISALRKGANSIDVVVNPHHIMNRKDELIIDDIGAINDICEKHGALTRVMFEYRHYDRYRILNICKQLNNIGIVQAFASTGHFVDDYMDNLLMGLDIQRLSGIDVITNGNIWTLKQYEHILKSTIFGARIKSSQLMKEIAKSGV